MVDTSNEAIKILIKFKFDMKYQIIFLFSVLSVILNLDFDYISENRQQTFTNYHLKIKINCQQIFY